MENKKSNVFNILLVIIVIGLIGFILYDKFIKDDNDHNSVSNNTTNTQVTTIEEQQKNDTTTIKVDSTITAYNNFLNNIKTRQRAEEVTFRNIDSYITIILGTDNNLYLEDSGSTPIPGAYGSGGQYTGASINISTVVRIFYTTHSIGEGGSLSGLLILKDNGELYMMKNVVNNDYSLEKLDIKYVVDAYQTISPSGETHVVDINGNEHVIK